MKNLYKIKIRCITHSKPRDYLLSHVITENEEQVFFYIDTFYNNNNWFNIDKNKILFQLPMLKGQSFTTYKDYIMTAKGEWDNEDLYFGKDLYAWELVKENLSYLEITILLNTKVAIEL